MPEAHLSCSFLRGGLALWPDNRMTPCCLGIFDDLQASALRVPSNPDSFDAEAWLRLRERAGAGLAQGVIPPECRACPQLRPGPQEADTGGPFFTQVNLINSRVCNISCNFCYLRKQFRGAEPAFNPHLGMFRDIVAQGLVSSGSVVNWGGGEPALHPNLRELYALFASAGCRQFFDTNAALYLDFLENDLASGQTALSCSLMTPEAGTYLLVMGRDLCQRAWENAARYAATGGDVRAKFIMLPENAGQEEAFVARCKRLGISICNVDSEIYETGARGKEAELIARAAAFAHAAAREGVDLLLGVGLTYGVFLQKISARLLEMEKPAKPRHITLTPKGQNEDARAGQIFLIGVHSDLQPVVDMRRLALRAGTTWKIHRYAYFAGQFYYFTDQPESPLAFETHCRDKLVLRFLSHDYSGKVRVRLDEKEEFVVDLYFKGMRHLEIDLLTGNISTFNRIF